MNLGLGLGLSYFQIGVRMNLGLGLSYFLTLKSTKNLDYSGSLLFFSF